MNRRTSLAAVLLAALLVGACSVGAGPGPSPSPTPPASPGPADPVTTPDEAAARVLASDPRFRGIQRLDRDLIGQGSWWEAEAAADGWRVKVEIGWGDCPAGCINRHDWVFSVATDGTLTLLDETGPPLPANAG